MYVEYLKSKILDDEKDLKQFINKEKKQVKEFYYRYMGLYDSGVEYKLIIETSDDILYDLLEKDFDLIMGNRFSKNKEYQMEKKSMRILHKYL